MNEFRFMDPAGRMGTVSAENFSAAYMAGGIPVEATPEIDLLSPSGELSSLHYSKASELLKSGQGWRVSMAPKPLRFSAPSGRTGTVKLGYESQALSAGGTLLLKELSTDKPLTVDLPRDPKIAAEPPDSPLGNWFGPVPKDPASLKGWNAYQALVAKNKKGKAGFWEGITPNATNVPFLGTALAAVDAGKAALTAQRLKEGKPASDQDVLDLNMFLAKQERESNATMLGKAGNVIIDMTTFMAEIGGSIKAFLAPLKGVLAGKVAAKTGTEAAKKLTVGMARRALREIGDDWAKNLVAKKAAAEAGEGVAEYLAKHGSRRAAVSLLGRLPEIGVATVAPTIGQIVPQLAATGMAGQDAGTLRGNQDKIYAALMGEDMGNAAAIWRSVADTTIENWSEAMGETILAGMSKIPVVGGIGQAIRKNAHLFVEKLGKAGTKEGFQAVDRIAGMTALSKWVYGKAKKGASFRMMMEDLHAVGYDGVFGEMMEERAGDFMRGLFGLEGEKDDNAVARAFKNSLPDPEQLGVELIAFSMPALAAGGLRFAALGTNADRYWRAREALDGLATLHKNRKPWEDGQFTSGDAEALQPIVRDIVREHEAYKKDSTGWAKYINSMLDGMLSMKIVDGGLVINPDVKYKNVMSVMIGTEGGRARAAYLENLGRDPTKEDLDKALDVGAEHAMRRMARQGGFIWLYDSTLRTTDGDPSTEAGSTTEKEALKYLSKTQLQALRDANLLTIDEFGKIFMLDPRSYDEDQHELMSLAFELGSARQTLEDKAATAEAREAAKKSESQALEKIGKLAPVKGASAGAVARLITLTPEEARDVALQQNIRFEGVLDLDLTEAEEKAAEARARIAAYENLELEADPPKGSLNEFLHRAVVSPESMTPEEKVRAASFLTNDPTAASLDAAASVGRRVHKLVQAGEIAFRGDKIVRTGDGQRFVVLSPFRAEKTKASMYRVAPLSETGVPLESQATAISAEDLKAKYRNETKTGTAISRISRFQGSLKSMVAHLHRSGYLGDWVRANRREGESIEKTLDRMTGQDLRGFGLVRSMKTAAGKELFYYDSGAFSLFHGPANKLSRGVAFNPMSLSGMEGAHFSEDFTEMPLLQLSADENGRGRSAERLRAAMPVLASAISRAQKEAEHVLVQATKNGKTAAERADAVAKLAILRKLPSVDSDDVLHVVEAMSKTVRHYIHGYKDFPQLRLLPLGDAVEALFENSSLSHDLPAIRAELETVASKEYWDALRYDRAIDAPEAPAADESTGKPPPPPPPSDGGQEGSKPPPPPPAGGEGPSVPASDLLDEGPSGGPAPAPVAEQGSGKPAPGPEAAQPSAEKAESPSSEELAALKRGAEIEAQAMDRPIAKEGETISLEAKYPTTYARLLVEAEKKFGPERDRKIAERREFLAAERVKSGPAAPPSIRLEPSPLPSVPAENLVLPESGTKLTGEQWAARDGTLIVDPDGWRKNDGVRFDSTPITWEDFLSRAAGSTARFGPVAEAEFNKRSAAAMKEIEAKRAERKNRHAKAGPLSEMSAQEVYGALMDPQSAAVPGPDPEPAAAPESVKLSGDADQDARALDPDLVKNPDAFADRLVRYRPGIVRRVGALKTIARDLMGSGLLSAQSANDMLLGYMASALRLSKQEAFDVLLALRWNPGAKALAESDPTEAEMEAELSGSLAEALGLSSDAEVPMASDKLSGSGNADMMDAKLKEVTDVVRVVLDAVMGYSPIAEIGRAIRKSAYKRPDGNMVPLGTRGLPDWMLSKESFDAWAAERKANMARYSANFAEKRLSQPLDAAEIMFNSVIASLPWRHALQIYKAAQNVFPREVLEIRQNDSFGSYYEALLPPDESGTQHPAVTGATPEEVAQNVAAQIKLGIYKGEISAEELAELIHEAGNGSAMVALNDAAARMAGEQARRLRRRLRPEEYFGGANAELRAAVERVAARMDSKRGEIGRFGAYLNSGASRFGFLMNEATEPNSPEWKKKLLEDAVEAVSLLLTGAKSSAFAEQLKKDLARDKGVTVAKSMQNLWEQLLEPLAKIERERLSGAGAESQRQVLAARDLNALIEGTAENPGVFYKALGLAYGGSELEAFAYMRDRKQFFQTNDKYLSKLLGQLAVRGVVAPVGRASGGKSFSGYRARSPMAEALERMAERRGDLRPGVLVSEAAGMDSVEGAEMSSAQVYDKLRGIARGAFLRLQKGEVGEVFLPMMLSGDKLELNGAVWSINGETKISGDKTFADYAGPALKGAALDKAFNEFFNDVYFGSAEKAGVHERFTMSLIDEVAPGALAPGGQFSLYRKKSDGKLERKSPAEIGKIIQDVMKRFSQIGTPIVDGIYGPPGYLQTAEDGMVEYVMLLKEDGTPYKGPGDGLLWIMPWLRDAARKTFGGTEKQASYKLGNWGQTDKGVLSQTKGAVVLDPNKYSKLDQSEPGAVTPAELEEALSDPSFREQLPDAMFLSTGNAQKMGPGKFDRVVEVVRGAKTYRFGVFRAAPLGITASLSTDTSLQERWVGMQPVAGGAGILNVPGGALDSRADYYRVFMDELYSGAEARIRKALETSDDKLFDGDNRRPMLDALAKAKGWLGGSLAAAQTLFARMRGIVNAAKKKNHVKLVSPIQSTGAARADGTLAPATDGPLEYDETAKLHPSGGQIVRGTAKPSSLSDHHRLANGGLTMPGMGLGLEDISEADLKRAAKHYEKLFGRRNIPANEKDLGAAAHELMTELVGMNPGATDFAKTRAILKALLAPVRTRSEFIPLDGSTVFGRSLDDAKKVVAHLQAKHHLLYDLARVKLDGGKGQFDVEYEHSGLSGYAGEGVNLDDFVVHSSEDGQTVIGFRIPGIPLLVHRSPALGHLQSMRVIRLTELTKDAAAIFYHQETLSKEGADEDGDQSHVFPLPPMSLLALHKSFEFLRDDEFEVAANARPDRFSDSYPKPLRDSWIASLVPENLERVTDPRIMAMSRDANLAGASAIGTAASMLTAIELAFRHVVLPKGVAELRDTAAEDPYVAVRFAVLHDMVNRIVDGGKVPHMMKGMMLYEQFVPVFASAIVGGEVPFAEGLEGQALYDHVHKHTVQEVTHWLSRTPKGRRLADNVLVGGMTLGKAFRAVYGKKAKSYQPKIAALLQLGDDMTTLSKAVRAVHKFKPTSLGDMMSLLGDINMVLEGQLESLPKLSDIPANSPLRFVLESLIVPFRAALEEHVTRISRGVFDHPTGTLSQEKAELLLANSRSKNLVWKRRSMDGESYDYGWTAAGLSRLWDLQLELHQRMALATMRARELATRAEFADMPPEQLAEEGLRGTVDPSKENSAAEYHVFDSVMRKRAELRATPEFADNVVLSALELSVTMPEAVGEKQMQEAENEAKKGRVPRIRVGVSDSFSVAEARRDWAKLPLSLQIDVFDLIVRYNGPHRSESRLYDLIPPEFMKSVFELERQIAAGIHDGSINIDVARPTNGGITLRGMMDFARESFLTQAAGATEENPGGRKIRHDGAGSYLRFAPFVQGWGPYFGAPAVPELLGENAGSVGLPAAPAPAPAAPAAPEAAQKSPKDVAVEAGPPLKFRTKELAKAEASNKVAALLDDSIDEASYAKRLGLAAQAAGLLVSDAAQVKEGDVVYASVPGGGRGAAPERIREFGEMLAAFVEAGAAVVTDNETNARRVHNAKGEGVVRDVLVARGFQETENKNYSLWRKGARMEAPAEAAKPPVGGQSIAAIKEVLERENTMPIEWAKRADLRKHYPSSDERDRQADRYRRDMIDTRLIDRDDAARRAAIAELAALAKRTTTRDGTKQKLQSLVDLLVEADAVPEEPAQDVAGQSAVAAASLDNPPEVQTEAWRMAVAYPKNGRTKESFFLRQGDPDSDLGDPESPANRNRRTILPEELSEAPLPADVEAALDDAMGLMNILLYRRPLPDGSGAPAAVFNGGVVFAESPNAVGPAIAALALKTVGENLPALDSVLDPATAQALHPTARSKYAGRRASTLVEAEIVRRLAGSPSLFSSPYVWPAALAADMADMLIHHPSELLKRSRVALVDGVPSLVSAEESRELAPADRSLSPNDSASWERMIESDRVPEKLRAKLGRLTDAHEAIEAVVEAVDAGRVKDPDYDKVESALVRSAAENLRVRPISGEPGEMARRELASGMSMASIYYHDPGTRIAALQGMGIPGQHLAFYEMMNQHTASWNNGAHWLNTKAKVLPYETATLYRLFTDEEGYRREDAKVHTHLTLSQRQAEKRFEAAVTAIMEHAHKFDLSNPAMREALLDLPGTVVYGKNQAAYRRGSDERSGILPERETIRQALSHFNAELRGLLLDPEKGGRTEAEIDPFLLAEEAKAQYEKDFKELNEAAFEFLDGREYLKFREGYAGMHLYSYGRGAGMDPAGDQALADIFDHVKHADVSLSFMKRPDGREDPSLKLSHKDGIPAWTDLQQKILGEQSPERLRRAMKRGRAPNVVEANRLIVDAIQENLYAVAAEYHAKHGAQAGSWKPSEAEKKQIATVKQLRDVLSRFRFVESAPAEFSRELETFAEAYEKKGLVPKSMSFLTLRGEYIDRVHTAASHKAILNSYLLITNPDGSPTIMAKPAADASLERGAITRDTWIKYGDDLARYFKDRFNRHAADVPVIDPVTKKVLFTTPGIIAEIRRLYDAHADKDGQFTSPRMSSVEAWSATDKDAGRLVKMLVQVSPTEIYPWAATIQSMLAWTKTLSFGWSFFFHTALMESVIGQSGIGRKNLAWIWLTRPFSKASREAWNKFWGSVRAFREHRRYYNPAVAKDLDFMLRMGMTTGHTAALEPYSDAFRKDMSRIGAGLAETKGENAAKFWMTFWFGADKTDRSWARFWPGITGRKMSDWMFDWFSAVKEAQMNLAVKKLAIEHGLNPDGRASWSQARFLAKYFDDGLGGQNWYRYLWATPKWMFGLNLSLLAPNWTLSSWNMSGLAPITQALFKNYPAPGEQRRIWFDYMPATLLWTMTIIPAALQAAAYLAGMAGGGDDDDVPLPWMNEPDRKQYVDVTPLMRMLPWYKGDPTGKRRVFIQFAKQVHETGISNPFGTRGWINEPWNQFLRKMPMPVRALYEQITGVSPGSDWQLEFNGKGILGIFNSGEPGLKGFMTSRLGYIAQKLIPMSASQFIQNPEVFPLNHFAPTSKGASQSKIVQNVASVLATYASAKDWHRIRKVPRARAALDSLVPEFLRAAEANGYNPEKVLATAKGMVLGDLYARMWQALDTNDEALMKATAASIWRVGGALKGLRSSLANKQKSFGIELTPEQEQQAVDALQWAMYGEE